MSLVLAGNLFSIAAFSLAAIQLHRHRVEYTLNGRAAQAMLLALLLLSLVGLGRRFDWEHVVLAQAVAWILAGTAALIVAFAPPSHNRDYPVE